MLLDIGCMEAGRRVVEANGAFEAELRGPGRETGGRDRIAEDIPRPGKLARLGSGVISSSESSTSWSLS
jgi:hypothetical protein